jgi:hypothetical protein
VCSVGCQHPDASETSVLVGNGATWCDRGVQTSLALARAQVRHGWRGLMGIVVLVAMIGDLVVGGFAGAQRTRTAVDRMIEQNEVRSRLADGFGTLAEPVVPLPGLLALVAAILVLAAMSGVVPIRAALRHRPGSVLRRE